VRIHFILCVCIPLVLPQVSLAKLPPKSSLGQVEGMLDFCARVDSQSAAKYDEYKKALVQGEPEKDVAEARTSAEYKESYDAISDALSKEQKDDVVKACNSLLRKK
jgi:hypothetical protein